MSYKYNKKIVARLFPHINDKERLSQLQIDNESVSYISIREYASKISLIIAYYLERVNIEQKSAVITDATAGVGGNVISFGMNFKSVNAVEIDAIRFNYLMNNINVYGLDNIKLYNKDCLDILNRINNHDVIFIDPPWGGKNYKKYKFLRLTLGGVAIESVCNQILSTKWMIKSPAMVVLKLPNNYDIKFLYDNLSSKIIYFHDLKKMFILVIINPIHNI